MKKMMMMVAACAALAMTASAVTLTNVSICDIGGTNYLYVQTAENVVNDSAHPYARFAVRWERHPVEGTDWENQHASCYNETLFAYGSNSKYLNYDGSGDTNSAHRAKIYVFETAEDCAYYSQAGVTRLRNDVIGYLRGGMVWVYDENGEREHVSRPWQWSPDGEAWYDIETEPLDATLYVETTDPTDPTDPDENDTCECYYRGYCHDVCDCDCVYCEAWRNANRPKQTKCPVLSFFRRLFGR